MAEDYLWDRFDPAAYYLSDTKRRAFFKGDHTKHYRPIIANKSFSEGVHYWRVQVPCDNMRVGLCTANCPIDQEMGTNKESWTVDLQTGDVWHNTEDTKTRSIYVPAPHAVARLYKLVVPISGGTAGLKLDLEEGTLMLYFNEEYMGIVIKDPNLKKKAPFFPCAALGGLEGKFATSPEVLTPLPVMYAYKRNKL
jgi:hypothetical protein